MVTSEGMVSLEVMVTLEMIGPEETMGAAEARCPRDDVARDAFITAGDERWVLPQAWIRPMGPLSPRYPKAARTLRLPFIELKKNHIANCKLNRLIKVRQIVKAYAAATWPSPEEEGPPISTSGPGVVVRAEEALIVLLVLVLWLAAIALFFNRWGKIRMLEPYQPKFQQQHRVSCPMVDINAVQHRSFSKFNLNCLGEAGSGAPPLRPLLRPRQNSVFVGGSGYMLPPHLGPPRKAKSAADLQTLV
ncbi:uncharacterized protein LOC124605947, partial [Schistocerca americana]|uniref:uncharacterized protein LOC124605947 n=1 Tax=Schistocerca americana TaxID=7009 RepID=UPI001F4FEB3D